MLFRHHDLMFEINDEWLTEADVVNFKPDNDNYGIDYEKTISADVFFVSVNDVEPSHQRAHTRGIFCNDDNTGEFAKARVIRILKWIQSNHRIEPVKVVLSKMGTHKYKLVEGCHRFHCALALGFKGVPATLGFDINDPYA